MKLVRMADTYASLNVHCVFSTKNRALMITDEIRDRLWSYLGGIARENHMTARCIGGVEDHVHILLSLPTTISVAKAVQLIKGGSSVWVHATFPSMHDFGWQSGYGAFSVSQSHLAATVAYIENQRKHHQCKTFQEEFLAFLKKHKVSYDERYIWD